MSSFELATIPTSGVQKQELHGLPDESGYAEILFWYGDNLKIILCGYHWTGCEALRQLLQANHEVFVFTHENPSHIPSLINFCKKTGTPFSLGSISKETLPFVPDCIASIYYRYIIKQKVIDACLGRIMNLHPSLLPRYRGCSSLTWAMIHQEVEAGFTYHYIDAGCDTGKILLQRRIEIMPFDTQGTLYQRVAMKAMESFSTALELVVSGAPGYYQGEEATYFPRGCPFNGTIDPSWPEARIETFIRSMIHPPYPPANFRGSEIHTIDDYRRVLSEGASKSED